MSLRKIFQITRNNNYETNYLVKIIKEFGKMYKVADISSSSKIKLMS